MASPVIRLAEPADLLSMSDLMERSLRRHVLKDCSREGSTTLLQSVSPEQLAENLAAGFTYHVAATSDAIYGVVGMKPPCDLHQLFVADVMQRQGLGRKLWHAARDGVCLQHSVPPDLHGPFDAERRTVLCAHRLRHGGRRGGEGAASACSRCAT
jgi:GNAT superfamily N-acetyltransferase